MSKKSLIYWNLLYSKFRCLFPSLRFKYYSKLLKIRLSTSHFWHPSPFSCKRGQAALSAIPELRVLLFLYSDTMFLGFPRDSVVKILPANEEPRVQSLSGEDPWRRKWQPIPVFLPGKSHRQRNLVGCDSWGSKSTGHDLATKTTAF